MITMVVDTDRIGDWFFEGDIELDPFLCSIVILESLSTRRKIGLKYNRIELVKRLINRRSNEALKALDAAIVLLTTRKLIDIDNESAFDSKILITTAGMEALLKFQEELRNEN